MDNAENITVGELAEGGIDNIPAQFKLTRHLIYSSPATLSFNSPGAQGFGVKRAGLAVPGSVMLLVSPGCCGRNTTMLSRMGGYGDRFFYLLLDDTDIVTGRYLTKIPEAVREVKLACDVKPSAVMICITCVDALLGTDMERVTRKCTEYADVPTVACYMYALTREKKLPPMAAVRKSVYSLLEKAEKRKSDEVNILGYFSPLLDDCEIYGLLKASGVKKIREISRCSTFEEYKRMSQANFNIVLNPESRYAAADLEERLGIPYIELRRLYQADKIQKQYQSFANAIGTCFDDTRYYEEAVKSAEDFKKKYGKLSFSVGECSNADPFELSLALVKYGFTVNEIFGTVGELNFSFIKRLAQTAPEIKVYSNESPSMLHYTKCAADAYIGRDAKYYHQDAKGTEWSGEIQPFGYAGVRKLFEQLDKAMMQVKL